MKLKQKKQILDLLKTLEDGVNYADRYKNNHLNAVKMLNDCVECLMFMATLLNEEKKVYRLILKLKDILYALTLKVEDSVLFQSTIFETKVLLVDVRDLIRDEIKTDLEIAFLPYKASMWDSLESIYREAEKDPNCTCFVVPIPYYEKNSSGEIVKFCYEGNQFPDDVNITLFEMYDIEKRQPDIIYIHNPFDEYNTLTMVNPRYFSSNLAQYTDMLVYVPYYLAGSAETKEFNILPPLHNATKLVVQSQASKDSYIVSGMNTDKLLNLGSPKLDAMLNILSEPNKVDIPYLLRKIPKNSKVILYSTGIFDLLSINTWIDNLEENLNYFTNKTECTFIWRPHPLTERTFKTMRSHLLKKYKEIEEKAKKASNIIIDQSEDIYPAVLKSDGLISDYSSVMLQYILTGKPVLAYLNDDMVREDRYYLSDYLGCYLNKDTSLYQFIEMVKSGEDSKRSERINRFKNSVSNSDGSCGLMIHQKIKNELLANLF
ncbi:CDP-glycerol glycerophosphotransferase family protein [Bacillus sinesaloumensis]|uniref:CDP-glycerol glycerophosphotransferase family protein n=1 Tax=Litchfieldia sinesaloumensis TaxID=1926280 RepID=UPI000988666B|nr:CDP-glycerol glycerophosphotransferase family protein [Bacillus sinesaloumensis]